MSNTNHPLLCDPEKGLCEIPGADSAITPVFEMVVEKPVKIVYFTDPICSSCWGIEPQLRRLKLEYGHVISIDYHMGGLLPNWEVYNSGGISKPTDVAHHWDEVSRHYEMPIDGDVWLEDPLPSSYPPSIAFAAARLQDGQKALLWLRRIREMVFLEKKNITRWEHLQSAALAVGLDIAQLETDVKGRGQTEFQADLQLGRQLGVRGFPTLLLSNAAGQKSMVYGFKPYEIFEKAIKDLYPEAQKNPYPKDLPSLLKHYPTLTVKELSILGDMSTAAAQNALETAEKNGLLTVVRTKNGSLWRKKEG